MISRLDEGASIENSEDHVSVYRNQLGRLFESEGNKGFLNSFIPKNKRLSDQFLKLHFGRADANSGGPGSPLQNFE